MPAEENVFGAIHQFKQSSLRDIRNQTRRGSTWGIALLKARTGGKLTVHIPDGRTGGDDKASSMLSSHIGALVHNMSHLRREKMEALQLQHESEGKSYTKVEIFTEVLGTKAGYVQDMEQTMREHQQMMEEQKDEELMQMMAEQQRKKRRASEDDAGAAKEPSKQQERDATNGTTDA
ncbi:hypothetical protein CJ030_MR3G022839 [Morella rubra]|uniref:Uncharacterized protein n=1 Tax=Morella rubra TaxID=262757 RepID=A0A6A1W8B6_9ROSI|nr:hypothetical protein CJ030_MR3G022839 [Morella rubra]